MVNALIRALLVVIALSLLTNATYAQCTGQPDANTVCAGPPSGGPGLPYFRSLLPSDVPAAGSVEIILQNNTTPINGGQNGRLLINSAGKLSDFQMGGDCTFTAPNISCTKLTGITFAPSATTDATNANNIGSGTLNTARLDLATVANFQAATANKVLAADRVFTPEVAVTYGATTTFNFSTFINASVTLTGNITTITFSNVKAGQAGMLRFIQDGTGGHTIPATVNSVLKCPGGCDYTLSTSANAVDVIAYMCPSTTYCLGSALIKDVK